MFEGTAAEKLERERTASRRRTGLHPADAATAAAAAAAVATAAAAAENATLQMIRKLCRSRRKWSLIVLFRRTMLGDDREETATNGGSRRRERLDWAARRFSAK